MKTFPWNDEKNARLKSARGVSFEEVVIHLAAGDILDIIERPNSKRYGGKRIFIVKVNNYAWLVPFLESEKDFFLKKIIPSRKAKKKYLS